MSALPSRGLVTMDDAEVIDQSRADGCEGTLRNIV
jgi:hypothetical protein